MVISQRAQGLKILAVRLTEAEKIQIKQFFTDYQLHKAILLPKRIAS